LGEHEVAGLDVVVGQLLDARAGPPAREVARHRDAHHDAERVVDRCVEGGKVHLLHVVAQRREQLTCTLHRAYGVGPALRAAPPGAWRAAPAAIPEAAAAAAARLEPPGERVRPHGLCVARYASGSVVALVASSGVLVLPTNTKPAARKRAASHVSSSSVQL